MQDSPKGGEPDPVLDGRRHCKKKPVLFCTSKRQKKLWPGSEDWTVPDDWEATGWS